MSATRGPLQGRRSREGDVRAALTARQDAYPAASWSPALGKAWRPLATPRSDWEIGSACVEPWSPRLDVPIARPSSVLGAKVINVESEETASAPADHPRDWLAPLRADPRQAVQEDSIRCLICGQAFRQLTNTHLRSHATSSAEYKRRFGYNRGRPLMCRALQRLYAERAVKAGLAARIRCRPILVEPELRRRGGSRVIALEESLTRREARRRAPGQNGGGT